MSKSKLTHLVDPEAEHDRFGGIKALCGMYMPAGYTSDASPSGFACVNNRKDR